MTPWILVRARRLHCKPLQLGGERIKNATLFPFFHRDGTVDQVMIVDADSPQLWTFRVAETRVRVPLWGAIRVDGPVTPVDEFNIDALAPLWHYDPWWLLKDERYADQAIIPILKATNCAEAFLDRQPSDVLFNQQMSRLCKVQYAAPSENYEHCVFEREMLPPRETACSEDDRPPPNSGGWQLIPIWT